MSFWTFFTNPYTQFGLFDLFLCCGFALWKGGPAERIGGLMVGASWLGADIAWALSGQPAPAILLFVSDGLISMGLLYIAIRYSSIWLGAAMLFRAVEFALHAIQMTDADIPRWHGMNLYLWANNSLNHLVLWTLAGGTIATMSKRRRLAREKAEAAAKAARRAERLTGAPPPLAGAV